MRQKKKSVLVIAAAMFIALCFVMTAVAKKPTPQPPGNNSDLTLLSQLPNGRPFQIIKTVLEDVLNAVCTLKQEVATLEAEIAKLQSGVQSEVVTIPSTGGIANLAITPAVVELAEGKQSGIAQAKYCQQNVTDHRVSKFQSDEYM